MEQINIINEHIDHPLVSSTKQRAGAIRRTIILALNAMASYPEGALVIEAIKEEINRVLPQAPVSAFSQEGQDSTGSIAGTSKAHEPQLATRVQDQAASFKSFASQKAEQQAQSSTTAAQGFQHTASRHEVHEEAQITQLQIPPLYTRLTHGALTTYAGVSDFLLKNQLFTFISRAILHAFWRNTPAYKAGNIALNVKFLYNNPTVTTACTTIFDSLAEINCLEPLKRFIDAKSGISIDRINQNPYYAWTALALQTVGLLENIKPLKKVSPCDTRHFEKPYQPPGYVHAFISLYTLPSQFSYSRIINGLICPFNRLLEYQRTSLKTEICLHNWGARQAAKIGNQYPRYYPKTQPVLYDTF